MFQYRYALVILSNEGRVCTFKHGSYISALEQIGVLILSIYVLQTCIGKIYKYCNASVF